MSDEDPIIEILGKILEGNDQPAEEAGEKEETSRAYDFIPEGPM